jgi:peptidoglycan/xylan/chitin deacetylase (PgdA/CDA1 family)
MFSVDDFHPDNIKLANLFKKYGLEKYVWFAIQLNDVDSINQIETLHKMGFNLASHTISHAFLSEVPIEYAYNEMNESKIIIDGITGKNTDWLVLPRGRGNEEIYKMAIDLGYKYIRTTKVNDENSYLFPELYGKIKGGNHLSYPRKEYNGVDPFDWAKDSNLNHHWLHCFEVEKFGLWQQLEKFLQWYVKKNN